MLHSLGVKLRLAGCIWMSLDVWTHYSQCGGNSERESNALFLCSGVIGLHGPPASTEKGCSQNGVKTAKYTKYNRVRARSGFFTWYLSFVSNIKVLERTQK